MKTALLSSTYFGPIQWYQKLHRYDQCLIECHDNFVTCPDGYQLSKTPMQDIRISDHGNWRHVHWNALCSAYGESPFFMYYEDDLRPFFEQKWTFLIDFNMAITEKMIELLDIQPSIRLTDSFVPLTPSTDNSAASHVFDDFRDVIRPKHPGPDTDFSPRPYYQVYQQKHGFQANMSILDLLFNEGNEAVLWL